MTIVRTGWVSALGLLASLSLLAACNNTPLAEKTSERAAAVTPSAHASATAAPVTSPIAATTLPAAVPTLSAQSPKAPAEHAAATTTALSVKRFVIARGVKDREPVTADDAWLSDGSAIYAYAELANPDGESENVRITFERKGSVERVGNVSLPIPGKVTRHRTWAFTRFIRSPGVWDAVLWSESGAELGRTSFEVKAS